MSSTITTSADGKEYKWDFDGTDGLRSYSFDASNSNWNYTKQTGTNSSGAYIFTDSSTGKPSARRGNLYNLTAATLGSSLPLTTSGQQASDSICPHGWQLPVNGIASDLTVEPVASITDKSFTKLLRTYGAVSGANNNLISANRAREWPLQYLPTGSYYNTSGYIEARTTAGYWWSNTVKSATGAYFLRNDSALIHFQGGASRSFGSALRCVAQGL